MPTFLDQYNLANDPNFQNRVRMASISAALAILSEARGKGFDDYHDKRAVLANSVLGVTANTSPMGGLSMPPADPEPTIQRIALAVSSNPAIDAPSSDSDIQFTVNSMWDPLAGITDDERPE